MQRGVRWLMIAGALLNLAMLLPACHRKSQPVPLPLGPAVPEELVQGYVADGDTWTRAMHLYAWRQAEKAYAASQFLTCAACLERSLRAFRQNIESLAMLDVEPAEKQALQLRMEMKMTSYRDSSVELMQRMIGLIRGEVLDAKWKQIYMETITDLLAKVRAIGVR